MNRLKTTLTTLFATTVLAGATQAATVSLLYTNGSLFDTTAISETSVTGADMGGMVVTACFVSNACQALTWASTTTTAGGVVGTGWSLGLNNDSFTNRFVLRINFGTSALASLSLNGRPGLVAFDVDPSLPASPGSAFGRPFTLNAAPGAGVGNIDVTYSDKLSIGGVFYDDLYTLMTMNFRGGTGFTNARMEFSADTDKTLNGAAIDPSNPVPTPGTLALVGLGLLGLAGQARRKSTS